MIYIAPLIEKKPSEKLFNYLCAFILFALPLSAFSLLALAKAGLSLETNYPFLFTTEEDVIENIVAFFFFNIPSFAVLILVYKIRSSLTWSLCREACSKLFDTIMKTIGTLVAIFVLLFVGLKALDTFNKYGSCYEYATVESIGGCDMFGNCSVNSTNGKAELKKPVIGETFCFRKVGFLDALF